MKYATIRRSTLQRIVAPLVGAWIEIFANEWLPVLEAVAPLVGAWIEIDETLEHIFSKERRSPRGSVD